MGTYLSKLCCCRSWKSNINWSSDPSPAPKDNPVFDDDIENASIDKENQHRYSDQHFSTLSSRRNVHTETKVKGKNYENIQIAVALYNYTARMSSELSFNQGDEIQIFGELNDNWWDAQLLNPPYTKGVVPYNYVAKKGSIETQPYFLGKMTRKEAEEVLSSSEISTFLVRTSGSKTECYALSVQDYPKVKHYLIYKDAQGYFIHCTVKKNTIPLLIEYHQNRGSGGIKKLGQVYYDTSVGWEFERSFLKLGREIGYGNFGIVYEATYMGTKQVAVKILKKGCLDSESFLKEADIMKRLIHPRIVRLYGVCTVGDPFYIVTELMPHGNLYKYLKEGFETKFKSDCSAGNGQYLDLPQLVKIGAQVASGMAYLEYNHYVHRDLAARNVLVGENNLCKISDFGFARLTTQDDTHMASTPRMKVPIRWTAPEALTHQTYTVKSDVWSFGILLTEIIEKGMMPYPDIANNRDVLHQLLQGYRMSHTLMPNCPDKLYDLMQTCWENDPKLRPSFADLFDKLDKLEKIYGPAEDDPYNT